MSLRSPVVIAQITDTHVRSAETRIEAFVDNNARLGAAVSSLNAEDPRPVVVVATGDLTEEARASEFERLGELLAPLAIPVLPLPGNHDDRTHLRVAFPDVPWTDAAHLSWTADLNGVRIVGLDTTVPGEPGGVLDAERERWLREQLADPHEGVTILAMHHPPFESGITWMDRSALRNADRLERVLVDHHVDRVVCGHLHRPISTAIAGVPVQVGVSTVQHVALDLRANAEPGIVHDPVGYQLHLVAEGRVVTHTRFVSVGDDRTGVAIVPSPS